MNNWINSPTNTSTRRLYHRRNRKGNRTNATYPYYFPVTTTTTTTLLTTNTTLFAQSNRVPINDLFAWISSLFQYKNILVIILCLFVFLCVISIIFVLSIWKCKQRRRVNKKRRQDSYDRKRLENLPDFLDDQRNHNENHNENDILLEPTKNNNSTLTNSVLINSMVPSDNISNTFSIDPIIEQKIKRNSQLNASASIPTADDTSVDTLRGSLASTPSQQISTTHVSSTPIQLIPISTTDSAMTIDEQVVEKEKDDDLRDLDLKRARPHFDKGPNSSTSNLAQHRVSASAIEQTIRKKEQNAEQHEREFIHGSNSNIYEKTIREQVTGRKPHTNSQVSLVSRTSEDSCY